MDSAMSWRRLRTIEGWLILPLVLAGCLSVPTFQASPPDVPLVEIGKRAAPSDILRTKFEDPRQTGDIRHVLVLSGGGMYGAYTAGYLNGWSESGQRPEFDVVTGVSTGALIAPFAFLGQHYDPLLKKNYTTIDSSDIYSKRLPVALLWSDSIANSQPLAEWIKRDITPPLLVEIAAAHRQGRRLYFGTTNLETKRLVIWDIGAIADGDDPHKVELVRRVLLASCSVPGFFPPVPIEVEVDGKKYTEWHVDGSVSASPFLLPQMIGLETGQTTIEAPTIKQAVHVVVAGKLKLANGPVPRGFLNVSTESLEGVLQSRFQADLMRIYLMSKFAGASFGLTAVPQDLPVDLSAMTFDTEAMQLLFKTGREVARSQTPWQDIPPVVRPEEQMNPRGSTKFVSRPQGPVSNSIIGPHLLELEAWMLRNGRHAVTPGEPSPVR
jgi:predicted patatin/cPLA2 family phospholipase